MHVFLFWICLIFTLSGCSILNSGTAHVKYSRINAKFDQVSYQNKERLSDISFSVRNVQHPSLFKSWASSLSIDPSIHYDRQLYGTMETFTNAEGEQERYPDIKVRRLSAFANGKWVNHTPIGQFALSAGYGLGLSRMVNKMSLSTIKTQSMLKLDMAYIGFVTDRLFLMFGPRYYIDRREEYIFAFRIGYFWGKKESRRGMIELISVSRDSLARVDDNQRPTSLRPGQD